MTENVIDLCPTLGNMCIIYDLANDHRAQKTSAHMALKRERFHFDK